MWSVEFILDNLLVLRVMGRHSVDARLRSKVTDVQVSTDSELCGFYFSPIPGVSLDFYQHVVTWFSID